MADPIRDKAATLRAARLARRAADDLAKSFQAGLFADVDRVTRAHGIERPGGYLAQIMAGVDPRTFRSRALSIVNDVSRRGPTEMPTEEEWFELADIITKDPRFAKEPIEFEKSQRAAEKLCDLLYVKRSKADVDVEAIADITDHAPPLTSEECELYDQWFAAKYG